MFGNNLKVHLVNTGLTQSQDENIALQVAGIQYTLYSCYPFIERKKSSYFCKDNIPKTLHQFKHVIQDSGLFTLMFGAAKDRKISYEELVDWQDRLIQFVQENNINATCVEVDAQKLVGPEKTWKLRERMSKLLKNRQIHVFHLEDGKYGLDRLIEYSDYIAISVPELRIHRRKTYVKDVHQLAMYIKAKKPDIDIHLLGCTQVSILKQNAFCTSSDSNSWMQGSMYGWHKELGKQRHVSDFKQELKDSYGEKIILCADSLGVKISKDTQMFDIIKRQCIMAKSCKEQYSLYVGDQN